MKRLILLACIAFSLSGCGPMLAGMGVPQQSAPLVSTQVDEAGYKTSLLAFEAFLDTVDALKAAKVLVPGTPTAIALADTIDTATAAFKTAGELQRAGNADSYAAAMGRAAVALYKARDIISKRKSP